MRKIKLFIATSLDGYIARTNGKVDWLFQDDDYGYNHFYASIDTLVMGRKTYDQILSFGDYPYPGKISYVLSHSHTETQDDNVTYIADNMVDFIRSLRIGAGRDIWLVGGSQVVQHFIAEKLIDEIILSVHPILLGEGIPLFSTQPLISPLILSNCIPYPSGLVQLTYQVQSK